jgi:hypothetical protein
MPQRFFPLLAVWFIVLLLTGCASTPTPLPEPTVTSPPTTLPLEPTVPSTEGRNPKKGISLAYPNCEDIDTLQVSWYFDQNPSPKCDSLSVPFIPRIFGAQQANDSHVLGQAIKSAQASGWLLGFVEPNLPWHGNVSPADGAKAWRTIEAAALPAGLKLVAPSPSQHAPHTKILPEYDPDPYGYTWLWAMVDAYQKLYGEKPHFDAMAWNFYENNPTATKAYLTARHEEALALGYDVPFWVMEYAGRCWDSDKYPTGNEQIMAQITPWFNDTPWIGRYAWFSNRIRGDEPWGPNHQSCSLLNPGTGQPTALGQSYRGY